jgi:hypothetical protein
MRGIFDASHNSSGIAAMIADLILLPAFISLSVALTVVVADLLSMETEKSKDVAKKLDGERAAAA